MQKRRNKVWEIKAIYKNKKVQYLLHDGTNEREQIFDTYKEAEKRLKELEKVEELK